MYEATPPLKGKETKTKTKNKRKQKYPKRTIRALFILKEELSVVWGACPSPLKGGLEKVARVIVIWSKWVRAYEGRRTLNVLHLLSPFVS